MLLRSEDRRCSEWRPGGRLSILMGYIKKRVIFLVSRSNCSVKSDSYVHFCCKTVTRRHSEIVVGRRQSSFGANILHPTNILDNIPTFMKTQDTYLNTMRMKYHLSIKFMDAIFVMLPIYIIYIDIKHQLVTHGYPCQHLSSQNINWNMWSRVDISIRLFKMLKPNISVVD